MFLLGSEPWWWFCDCRILCQKGRECDRNNRHNRKKKETEYGWYLCLDEDRIIAGLGVIENDFHNRKDLTPNLCAVYTEEAYRCQGIAGHLLNMAVEELRTKGITPVYLITDHTSFYERYGWEFFCMVQGEDEPDLMRMYIHRWVFRRGDLLQTEKITGKKLWQKKERNDA